MQGRLLRARGRASSLRSRAAGADCSDQLPATATAGAGATRCRLLDDECARAHKPTAAERRGDQPEPCTALGRASRRPNEGLLLLLSSELHRTHDAPRLLNLLTSLLDRLPTGEHGLPATDLLLANDGLLR